VKSISLWQPWASLVSVGAKRVETRGWQTPYRGPLAIHASKKWDRQLAGIMASDDRFTAPIRAAGIEDLPLGCVVAVARLAKIAPTAEVRDRLSEQERLYGDYSAGRYAWALTGIVRLARPVPFKGAQGFFEVPDELLQAALAAPPPAADGPPSPAAEPAQSPVHVPGMPRSLFDTAPTGRWS
jgi:hypothetical protein